MPARNLHRELGTHPELCERTFQAHRSLIAVKKEEARRRPSSEILRSSYADIRDFFGTPRTDLVTHVCPDARVEVTAYSVPTWVLNLARVRMMRVEDACYYSNEAFGGADRVPPRIDRGPSAYSDYSWAFATLLNWRLLSTDPDGPHAANLRYKTAAGVDVLTKRLAISWNQAVGVVLLAGTLESQTTKEAAKSVPDDLPRVTVYGTAGVEVAIERSWMQQVQPNW